MEKEKEKENTGVISFVSGLTALVCLVGFSGHTITDRIFGDALAGNRGALLIGVVSLCIYIAVKARNTTELVAAYIMFAVVGGGIYVLSLIYG